MKLKGKENSMTVKEKKKILNEIQLRRNRIENLKNKISAKVSEQPLQKVKPTDKMQGGSNTADILTRYTEAKESLIDTLRGELAELVEAENRIYCGIKHLPLIEREILELRYIDGKSLLQVSHKLNYSYDHIRHLHGIALLHLEI